jgi:hypothetical protein
MEFRHFASTQVPEDFPTWSEDAQSAKLSELMAEFQTKKQAEYTLEARMIHDSEYMQQNFPGSVPEHLQCLYDPQFWLDGVNRPVRRSIKAMQQALQLVGLDGAKVADAATADYSDVDPEAVLLEVAEHVYQVDMFSTDFCDKLRELLDLARAWREQEGLTVVPANSMHKYGCVLASLGLQDCVEVVSALVMHPLAQSLFPWLTCTATTPVDQVDSVTADGELVQLEFDRVHAFIAEYHAKEAGTNASDLDLHVDSSHLTLNVCLGGDFTGGELHFAGYRCPSHQAHSMRDPPEGTPENITLTQEIGRAFLHVGNIRHAASKIGTGDRQNLIIWSVSSDYQQMVNKGESELMCGVCDGLKNQEAVEE